MALITAAEYKTFMEITDTGQDTLISTLIPAVQKKIEKKCNRLFEDGTTERTEYFDGAAGMDCVFPKYLPIVSVTTLHDDPLRSYDDAYLISSDDYVAYERRIELDGLTFNRGKKNIQLIYKGGYITTGETANVPDDLKLALAKAINWNIQRRDKMAMQNENISALNVSTSFIVTLPEDIMDDLGPYVRHVL